LIAFLALHRDAVALFQSTTTPDSVSYEEAEDIVYEQAKKTLNKAMEDFNGSDDIMDETGRLLQGVSDYCSRSLKRMDQKKGKGAV
jgi:hypothetical protein